MADFFEGTAPLALLHEHLKVATETTQYLFRKMGVRPSSKKIVLLAISEGETVLSTIAMMSLVTECEKLYKKKIEITAIKIVSVPSFEKAKLTPYLELADFILVTDKDLLDAESYPELNRILFQK